MLFYPLFLRCRQQPLDDILLLAYIENVMTDNKVPPTITPDEGWSPGDQLLLTIDETCKILRVSKWTVYRLMDERKLASVKIRSRRLIPVQAVRDLIKRVQEDSLY